MNQLQSAGVHLQHVNEQNTYIRVISTLRPIRIYRLDQSDIREVTEKFSFCRSLYI